MTAKITPAYPNEYTDPVTGQCVPGAFWNGAFCAPLDESGYLQLPGDDGVSVAPVYIEPIEPVPPTYIPPPSERIKPEPVFEPPVYVPPVYEPPQPVDYADPINDDLPVYTVPPVYTPPTDRVPVSQPFEPTPTCPPGYSYHPVSGDCVPAASAGTVQVTGGGTVNEPQDGPANVTPTTTSNPLAALFDANGNIFGFPPLYVGVAAAGILVLLVLKD